MLRSPFLLKRFLSTAPPTALPSPPKQRFRRLKKFTIYTTTTIGLVFAYDYAVNESTVARTVRAFYTLGLIGYDYKFRFNEKNDIPALHERNATRLVNVLLANKGLYIKVGQNLANQATIFPKAYQEKFSQLYDSASTDSFDKIEEILISELGNDYRQHFNYIDKEPIASASIGQVHKGELKTGEKVAIKVQHHYIQKQIEADFMTFGFFNQLYEWAFEIPVSFMNKYICDHMREEADFTIEVTNLERAKALIKNDSHLHNKIYVPEVYHKLCSKRVLVAEWCDGESLVNHKKLNESAYSTTQIMNDYVTLFSKMIFQWGFVHSDPHPGNLLVRFNPKSGSQELVLLDHGLYIQMRESVRHDYCRLWKSLFELDEASIRDIAISWGIGSEQSDMFGSMALLKPYHKTSEKLSKLSKFEREQVMAKSFKSFFADTTRFPLELIFLGRTMRIVQGVNQRFGAPVNRINIFTREAVKGYYLNEPEFKYTLSTSTQRFFRYSIFLLIMSISDFAFWAMKFSSWVFGTKNSEDLLESKMKEEMKKMGMDIPDDVDIFSG